MRKGFLTIEYGLLIVVIISAILGMLIYMKRAINSKWRETGDSFGFGRQYEPGPKGTKITESTTEKKRREPEEEGHSSLLEKRRRSKASP